MRLWLAIALGLLIGGVLAWWLSRPPAPRPSDDRATSRATQEQRAAPARLYRWRDDQGVLQVTDRPPAERPYEVVDIPYDRNIVPMRPPEPEPPRED